MKPALVLTIDTEPDNQWTMPAPGRPAPPLTFENTRGLDRLLGFLRSRQLKATWLTSWSVARDERSVAALRRGQEAGDEIGAHLHAWETPPHVEADDRAHPYLYEYEPEVQRAKLAELMSALRSAFGRDPVTYRAGRWGIDSAGLRLLAQSGFIADTSVVPGIDFSGSPGLSRPGPDFRRHMDGGVQRPWRSEGVWEVPASTRPLGWLPSGSLAARLSRGTHQATGLPARAARSLLSRSGACRLVWLRPLLHPASDLAAAARSLAEEQTPILNVMFHSSETFAGTSPRTAGSAQVDRFYRDLGAIAAAVVDTGMATPMTLSEAVRRHEAGGGVEGADRR